MKQRLFITGPYRSGTTLAQQLITSHPDATILYQPFPTLFHTAKADFLRSRRLKRVYPLDDLFRNEDYSTHHLTDFLTHWSSADNPNPSSFSREYDTAFRRALSNSGTATYGSKEILCEEFTEYLLTDNTFVVILIRDPRDMAVSVTYGSGSTFTGLHRPLLYSLRSWRKSVAMILTWQNHPRFISVRFEDLVTNPAATLSIIASALHLPPWSEPIRPLGSNGQPYISNSSFSPTQQIDTEAIGRHHAILPSNVKAYIEYVCGPEMHALGYLNTPMPHDESALTDFEEPVDVKHPLFAPHYSTSSSALQDEIERRRLLCESTAPSELQRPWFISERAYQCLHAMCHSASTK